MDLDKTLALLAADPQAPLDVAEVALALAADEYPALDSAGYLAELDAMAHEIRPRMRGGLEMRLGVLCRYLFQDLGFRGDTENYYDPRNSYLSDVMDRRLGLPIALSVLAMALGRRTGMEIVGVGLPGHFVAKAVAGRRGVVFDPFHGGRILSPEMCAEIVEQAAGSSFTTVYEAMRPVPLGAMVTRMLNNLKSVYAGADDFRRVARVLERLRQLNPTDANYQRDLGAALLQSGLAGKAIGHLEGYLDREPHAADHATVAALLEQARRTVAAWN